MREKEAIQRVMAGESISKVARETGIVRQQLQAWISGIRHLGVSEIQDKPQDSYVVLPNEIQCNNSCTLKSELEMIRSQGKTTMPDCSVCEKISQLESELARMRDCQCQNCEMMKKEIEVLKVSQANTEKLKLNLHSLQTQYKQLQSEMDSKISEINKLYRCILILSPTIALAVGGAIGAVVRLLIF